jgi:hypothetical protein
MFDVLLMRADKMQAVGLPITSVSADGVTWAEKPTAEQEAAAQEIIDALPLDYKEPEYIEKRQMKYAARSIGDQLDAIYHFAKDFEKYVKAGKLAPDANAPVGSPEEWIAWQDAIRQEVPKE